MSTSSSPEIGANDRRRAGDPLTPARTNTAWGQRGQDRWLERWTETTRDDSVTHLPNRALLNERVPHAVARARREDIGLAVIFVDLDDFKTVNDSLGHVAGDTVLLDVAQRISASVRAADTAARFGGDEFAILLEGVIDLQLQPRRPTGSSRRWLCRSPWSSTSCRFGRASVSPWLSRAPPPTPTS